MVSVYRLVKIWNSPQFPAEFRNGQYREVRISFCHDMQARDTEKKRGPNITNRNKRVHIFAHSQDFRYVDNNVYDISIKTLFVGLVFVVWDVSAIN